MCKLSSALRQASLMGFSQELCIQCSSEAKVTWWKLEQTDIATVCLGASSLFSHYVGSQVISLQFLDCLNVSR